LYFYSTTASILMLSFSPLIIALAASAGVISARLAIANAASDQLNRMMLNF